MAKILEISTLPTKTQGIHDKENRSCRMIGTSNMGKITTTNINITVSENIRNFQF